MKKIKLLFCLSVCIFSFSLCDGQAWDWGRQGIGTTKNNYWGSPVATDKVGNAYIGKQYLTSIIFGTDTLSGNSDNAYLVKYNSSGVAKWARQPRVGAHASSFVTGIATDPSCNIYVTGFFTDSVIFGSYGLFGSESAFLVKYDSIGNVVWAKQSAWGGTATSNAVTSDANGNIYITGYFFKTIFFGSYSLTDPYPLGYGNDVFTVKYDNNGNVLWAKQSNISSSLSTSEGNSISTDRMGHIYITGYFEDTIQFGTYSLYGKSYKYSHGNTFITKYDSTGNVIWAKQSTAASVASYADGTTITIDRSGFPYISGYFTDTVNFGSTMLISKTDSSLFLTRYDTSGAVLWAEQSKEGSWIGYQLASDANNYVYVGGLGKSDSLKFGTASFYNPPLSRSSFILKVNPTGMVVCGSMLTNGGGAGYNFLGIASDSTGQFIYMCGTLYSDSIFCGPDTLYPIHSITEPYLARWMNCNREEGIPSIISSTPTINLFPNPNGGVFTIQVVSSQWTVDSKMQVEIYNVLGEKVKSEELRAKSEEIDLTNQPNGIYFYRVLNEDACPDEPRQNESFGLAFGRGSVLGSGKIIIQK